MNYIVGVDIGGTKCAVTLGGFADGDITILDKVKFPSETPRGVNHTLGKLIENVEEILAKNNKEKEEIAAIGISCGGPLDSKCGIIMSPPNLYGWDNIPIVDIFEEKLGIKTKLQNDANACALAEWKFGAGKGTENMIFLTFGTGLGAGLILDGKLYTGTNDMAGEVGHIRLSDHGPVGYGKSGAFEGFCSGGGIAQLARTMALERLQMGEKVSFCEDVSKLGEITAQSVAMAAKEGDELALEVYRVVGDYLGRGLSVLIDILNPEAVVIGSIFTRCEDLLRPEVERVMEREALSHTRRVCRLLPAALGEQIGDYAALAVAVNE